MNLQILQCVYEEQKNGLKEDLEIEARLFASPISYGIWTSRVMIAGTRWNLWYFDVGFRDTVNRKTVSPNLNVWLERFSFLPKNNEKMIIMKIMQIWNHKHNIALTYAKQYSPGMETTKIMWTLLEIWYVY